MLVFQLHAKAQQAKLHAEEAGVALKQWKTKSHYLVHSILLFFKFSSPLSSGPYAYTCLYFHWCVWMADKLYQQSVNVLATVREDWLKEHVHACEVRLWERSPKKTASETTGDDSELNTSVTFPPVPQQAFEAQTKERINYLRNMVWTHLNQLSQQCVTSDEVNRRWTS